MSSAVPRIKLALRDLLQELFPAALIAYGEPQTMADQMASVGKVLADHDRPTVGGPTRSREETANVEVILSCFAPGDGESEDDAQQRADLAAYAMLDVLVEHFRDRNAATLSGACRDANVSSHESDGFKSADSEGYPTGRICEITATITCRTRI